MKEKKENKVKSDKVSKKGEGSKLKYDKNGDPIFTKENKKDYTLLVPPMITIHFEIMKGMLENFGYKVELLENRNSRASEVGLKYVHNDTCYPATIVIGQFMETILSGKYDPHKIALVISQTGGGCRASNYLHLLKKALKKAGYGYIPVLSFSFGMSAQPGFRFSIKQYYNLAICLLYGDLIMLIKNQCQPYEVNKGETENLVNFWIEKLKSEFRNRKNLRYKHILENYDLILDSFGKIKLNSEVKPKVGIVGEIYVKYSPLGNNNLEKFLIDEGAEVYLPGLMDFMMYCFYNKVIDHKLYGKSAIAAFACNFLCNYLIKKGADIEKAIKKQGSFRPAARFNETRKLCEEYISPGMKMGEGWLLTAEMVELINRGFDNIICTQPFGCLPNHIAGKGVMKKLREKNPSANIIAIDYDASASKINQENRIKLMLSNAREKLNLEKENQNN